VDSGRPKYVVCGAGCVKQYDVCLSRHRPIAANPLMQNMSAGAQQLWHAAGKRVLEESPDPLGEGAVLGQFGLAELPIKHLYACCCCC